MSTNTPEQDKNLAEGGNATSTAQPTTRTSMPADQPYGSETNKDSPPPSVKGTPPFGKESD